MKWRAGLLIVALAAAFVPIPPAAVESLYSNRFFPPFQNVATGISNRVPFALFDVLVVGATLWWLFKLLRDLTAARQVGWLRTGLRLMLRTATIASAAYLA